MDTYANRYQETIKMTVIEGLERAYKTHAILGESGKETIKKNQFGETALLADIECEQAIIGLLQESNLPIRIFSEEHGKIDIADSPCLLAVLDGLDGSGVYRDRGSEGRYGTMFAIFDGVDPKYKNYIAGGIMEHPTARMFFYVKNKGAFVSYLHNGDVKRIMTSMRNHMAPEVKVYCDDYFEINRRTFSDKLQRFSPQYLGSSAVYYADVASGNSDLALECTRKGNLEIAVAYGLIKEAGGVVVDLNGKEIGDREYLTFGQSDHVPLITAASPALAESLLAFLKTTEDTMCSRD